MSSLFRALLCAFYKWSLDCNVRCARACTAAGIVGTKTRIEWDRQAEADRVRIALLEKKP